MALYISPHHFSGDIDKSILVQIGVVSSILRDLTYIKSYSRVTTALLIYINNLEHLPVMLHTNKKLAGLVLLLRVR